MQGGKTSSVGDALDEEQVSAEAVRKSRLAEFAKACGVPLLRSKLGAIYHALMGADTLGKERSWVAEQQRKDEQELKVNRCVPDKHLANADKCTCFYVCYKKILGKSQVSTIYHHICSVEGSMHV